MRSVLAGSLIMIFVTAQSGCASLHGPPDSFDVADLVDAPELADVPNFQRTKFDSGPAAPATTLDAENVTVTPAEPPPPGHERSIPVPRLAAGEKSAVSAPVIDGKLDDSAWAQAFASSGFWDSIQDKAPVDQTEVLVMMDDKNLYFGFRLHDSDPEAIQSTRTVRDGSLGYDDSITVQLDAYFNRRDISDFSLNPMGTQTDAIAGGRSAKIEWKGDWLGAAVRTEYGWSAEFAIPFAILNYNDDATRFGVNFKRYQSRTKENSYWANITPQGLEEEMGQLNGLKLPALADKKNWTFMPFALAGKNVPDQAGNVDESLLTAGMDIRYQPRPDLTAAFSVNPDFSQVEQAITDISFSYAEKSLKENRPFFAEGASYFSPDDDDNEYFYSNRVPDFDVGGKSFGRVGRAQFGLLTTAAPDNRLDFVGRALYEVDETNSAIATVVSTRRPEANNLLTVAQFRGRQPSGLNYSIDVASTRTSSVTVPTLPTGDGSHYKGTIGWKGDYLYSKVSADKYDAEYFPANALLDKNLPGTKGTSLVTGYYRELARPMLHIVQGYVGTKYRDTLPGEKQERKVYAGGSVEFTSPVRFSLYTEQGQYRPVTDERGVFKPYLNDDRYSSLAIDLNTRSNKTAGGFEYDSGNLGGGTYKYYAGYGWWRPVNTLYFKLSAERIDSFGVYDQVVLVTSWDITPEHVLSGRYIYGNGSNSYRLAYSRRPRQGLDFFVVYDTKSESLHGGEFSVKAVKTF